MQRPNRSPLGFNINVSTEKYTIMIDAGSTYGYFENNKTGSGGGLWFEVIPSLEDGEIRLSLIDYDGFSCLPISIIVAMRDSGITVSEDFE
jgi:hypothetical protein